MARARATRYRKAQLHLTGCDPALARVIARVGPCTLQPEPAPFVVLVRAIVAQVISTRAAAAIYARLAAALPGGEVTPAALAALGFEPLRQLGLSGAKAQALLDLAARAQDDRLPLDRLADMTDVEVAERLVAVRGIGTWTAEMFLIFCLGRPDVLPADDFGLRAGVRDLYGLPGLPGRREVRERAEPWRPYRSIATWYLWRSRGPVPQSD